MIKVKKCEFAKKKLKFLGHIISREGIRTDPEKIEKMVNIGPPKNLKELRSRLGLFSFYRQYIKGFSNITKLMYELTQIENGSTSHLFRMKRSRKPLMKSEEG